VPWVRNTKEAPLSLKGRSIKGVMWSAVDVLMRNGLQFVVTVILSRLLTPEEFGTVALLYIFTITASSLIDGGFSSALVQRHNTTLLDESTVFWFNVGSAAAVALVLSLASHRVATFYGIPLLEPLLHILTLTLFISAFGSVHSALLSKALDFRSQTKIAVIASSLSGTLAVLLALFGAGVWALAFPPLLFALITVLLLWTWNPWRPIRRFSLRSLKSLFRFGGFMLVAGILGDVCTQLYAPLLGMFYGTREVGLYFRALGTQQQPVAVVVTAVNRVAFPALASVSADHTLFRLGLRKALKAMMLFNAPMMLGAMVVAEPLVVTLFGATWLPIVPVMRILCLSGLLWPLHAMNLTAWMAQGRSGLVFRVDIATRVLGIIAIVAASAFGLLAIAWAQVAIGVARFLINAHYTGALVGYGVREQLRDFIPYLLVSIAMALTTWSAGLPFTIPAPTLLAIQVAVGAFFYGATCKLLRLSAFEEAYDHVRGVVRRSYPPTRAR
jgi:teichuronic acid exporter